MLRKVKCLFGYIQPKREELKIKEFELYKAVYCSLCKVLGKNYGFFARITLSYDFTFLSLLKLSLKNGCNNIERKCCVYNPLKKCNYLKESENDLDYTAAAAAILLYFKMLDNVQDEKGIKKLAFKFMASIYKPSYKKAKNKHPNLALMVEEYIATQTKLENENCSNLDMIAEPTAKLLGNMLKEIDKTQEKALYYLGYNMGKWIYLTDCLADIEEDFKNNKFNPLLKEGNTKEYAVNRLKNVLDFCQVEAASAFELLKIYKYKDILGNIIYLGLDNSRENILKEKTK